MSQRNQSRISRSRLAREDERPVDEIVGRERFALRQGVVAAHERAPDIAGRQLQDLVAVEVRVADEHAEVDAPVVEALAHVLGVAAIEAEAQ